MRNKSPEDTTSNIRLLISGPYPPPFGGISSLIKSLTEGLKDKGIDQIYILYFGEKNQVREVDGAIVYEYSLIRNLWRLFIPKNWYFIFYLPKIFSGNNLSFRDYVKIYLKTVITNDLVNKHKINTTSYHQSENSFHILLLKRIWGKTRSIILNVYGEIYDVPDYLLPRKELILEMLKQCDAVISSSCHCANSFEEIGNSREINVVYVGVSLSRFNDRESLRNTYRKEIGIDHSTVLLLFMGRFNKEMGLNSILEISPELFQHETNFHLICAGASGPLDNKASEFKERFLNNLTVMNNIPFDMQPSLYAAADIVLTPSRDKHACMGVSIKEAMAARVPVIASNSGGIPEAIIDKECGVIVPLLENGENDLVNLKNEVISLSEDAARREMYAKNARKRAEDIFSEEATIEKTYQIFRDNVPN